MSKFIVSARKYRPSSFDEVVGQDHVARTLKNALVNDQLAHAFLFTGPRGVGKTTCARILAKVINCENPINKTDACNQCNSCQAFNENASFNILELDAASNNSVEHIRTLIEQVRFQPQQGKYKIFIIDEVHMLTTAAFNAFLKTLEEPPSYAIFILATTEKHKIIPTILSRCQIFDFKRIQIADAVKQLEKICIAEGRKAEMEALHTIAVKADGAMRDALSIFDKIASASGDTITYKDVIANLNLLDYEYYFRVTDAFLREDFNKVFLTLNEIIRDGFDPEQFLHGLADHFRELIIAKDPVTLEILEASQDLRDRYKNQASLASKSFLLSGLNILNQCDIHLPSIKNRRLHIELALSKIVYLQRMVKTDILSGSTQEKKTDVVTDFNTKATEKDQILPSETPAKVVATSSQSADNQIIGKVEMNKPSGMPVGQQGKTPSFGNLDAIKRGIVEKELTKAESRQQLTIESVTEIWNSYAENNPSNNVKTALKLARLSLSDKKVVAEVPTTVTRDMIMQESGLAESLREKMDISDLLIEAVVNKEAFPDYEEQKPVQALTQKEKYLLMLEKNPDLGKLSNKIKLKLDNEMIH